MTFFLTLWTGLGPQLGREYDQSVTGVSVCHEPLATKKIFLWCSQIKMQGKSGSKASDQLQKEGQPGPFPGIMNVVILPESFSCKGGYLMSFVQEIDFALSLVFYYIIFLTREYFCWSCPVSTFHNFGYWLQEIFPCLPQMPYCSEFAGNTSTGVVFNCDLVFPDLCKQFCILWVLIFALPTAALIHAKGLARFSPRPFQYVKRPWIF